MQLKKGVRNSTPFFLENANQNSANHRMSLTLKF